MRFSDIDRHPSGGTLRQFAGLCALFLVGLSIWHGLLQGRPTVGDLLAAAALVIGIIGLVRPHALRWLFVGWIMLAFPIGWAVSHLLLGAVFYGLFTPLAFLFRLTGRDALVLRRQESATSYWRPRQRIMDVRRYFRQY